MHNEDPQGRRPKPKDPQNNIHRTAPIKHYQKANSVMASSKKAVFLSALIFPGSGQLIQKKPIRGVIIMIMTSVCVYILFSQMMVEVNEATQRMARSGSADFNRIIAESKNIQQTLDTPSFRFAKIGIILCWLFSVIDAFFEKKQGKSDQKNQSN